MNDQNSLPRAVWPFVEFATALRMNGFAVAPEQTQAFIAAVGLLGPRSMQDIYRASVATLAPPQDRMDEYDALFRLVFLGQAAAAQMAGEPDEDVPVHDEREGEMEPPEASEEAEAGSQATAIERLTLREFADRGEDAALTGLRRRAEAMLPRRQSRRRRASRHGDRPDTRRLLRRAVKSDGELLQLPVMDRKQRQRRILLLIDVSGSMKAQTDSHMRFAHALAQAAQRLEVFTLGTRLTRVTRALKLKNREQALATTSTIVADWDGGTRLGDALDAFLSVPRFAGFARGALVVMLSDGLERGEPTALIGAMERLSRLAWKILWLSPLAGEAGYEPQTEALQRVLPYIDRFGDASSTEKLCASVLAFGREAA